MSDETIVAARLGGKRSSYMDYFTKTFDKTKTEFINTAVDQYMQTHPIGAKASYPIEPELAAVSRTTRLDRYTRYLEPQDDRMVPANEQSGEPLCQESRALLRHLGFFEFENQTELIYAYRSFWEVILDLGKENSLLWQLNNTHPQYHPRAPFYETIERVKNE